MQKDNSAAAGAGPFVEEHKLADQMGAEARATQMVDGNFTVAGALLTNGARTIRALLASEPDPRGVKRYDRLKGSFTELQAAAQHVVDETDRIHDGSPWPTKYRAPYGAITKLRELLGRQYGLRALASPPRDGGKPPDPCEHDWIPWVTVEGARKHHYERQCSKCKAMQYDD